MNDFFRPYGNHNYEYPDLPARPPSDSAISLNEKCQSFLNCKNFETNGSVTGSKPEEHSPRRISDPGTCRPSAKTVESVSFEGPLFLVVLTILPILLCFLVFAVKLECLLPRKE